MGDGDRKKFTKNPRHFSMQNSQATTKKIFTNFFWRAGKVRKDAPSLQAQMKIFQLGSHRFRDSLRESLRELWFSHCSSRETPFREWDFSFRALFFNSESCSENTPEFSQRDVIFFGQISAKKKQEVISVHDVWEALKQAILASRDVIISSQICVSKFQSFFTLGDRC